MGDEAAEELPGTEVGGDLDDNLKDLMAALKKEPYPSIDDFSVASPGGQQRGAAAKPTVAVLDAAAKEEAFKARLLLLAKANEEQVVVGAPQGVECAGDLEDKLKDLLSALNKESPGDPLSAAEAAKVEADAMEAVKASEVGVAEESVRPVVKADSSDPMAAGMAAII